MDLPTHFAFVFAIGLLFFDKPEIALLIARGSSFSDLDREYWFMLKKRYADEQIHRAGLHNVIYSLIGSPASESLLDLHICRFPVK